MKLLAISCTWKFLDLFALTRPINTHTNGKILFGQQKMNMFSEDYPEMRLIWDATTLDQFMRDPLIYYWKYVLGYRERTNSIALAWGTAWDKAAARYHYNRSRITNQDEALAKTIDEAIKYSWEAGLDEIAEGTKDHNKRNTKTLIRSLVWFDKWIGKYDRYAPLVNQSTTRVKLLDIKAPCGSPYQLVANFDQVVASFDGSRRVVERKSTTKTINTYFWYDYDPSVQTNTYDLMANEQFGTSGVIMEGLQTAVTFSRFEHHHVNRTPGQRAHWLKCIEHQIRLAEDYAIAGDWTSGMNPACQRWDNKHRELQRVSPASWPELLEYEFERGPIWNPLEID